MKVKNKWRNVVMVMICTAILGGVLGVTIPFPWSLLVAAAVGYLIGRLTPSHWLFSIEDEP